MWCVTATDPESAGVVANISLDRVQYGKKSVLPGDTNFKKEMKGYSFRVILKDKKGNVKENYITSNITDESTLVAVTESQFKKWSKLSIVARPVIFRWKK